MSDLKATDTAQITVLFRDLEEELIAQIKDADFVVGCVAWLTNTRILEALTTPRFGTSVVVQKEDFLRPDATASRSAWKRSLRESYDRMFCGLNRYCVGGLVRTLSVGGDPTLTPIRCVGNHNRDRVPAFPRMHNKFLVFCKIDISDQELYGPEPYPIVTPRVWTGSFNLTDTATRSFENAVLISSDVIARAYFDEWAQILAISEPLDWKSDWVEPEWRVGT